jgi:hypothetical protein
MSLKFQTIIIFILKINLNIFIYFNKFSSILPPLFRIVYKFSIIFAFTPSLVLKNISYKDCFN